MESKPNILITGASGFIGIFLVTEALERGYHVFAGVRKTSNTDLLLQKDVEIITLPYEDPLSMLEILTRLPKIDFVIHNAGVTKSISRKDYEEVNFLNTKNLILALSEPSVKPKKLVFISSIAARGPVRITEAGNAIEDRPISAYGKSKLMAENYLKSQHAINYVIIRPTAVFGPGDKDFLEAVKIINHGIDLQIGFKKRLLSFIYVKDLAALVLKSMESLCTNKSYLASDGYLYDHYDFGRFVSEALNKKSISIKVPVFAAKIVALYGDIHASVTKRPMVINSDKIRDLSAIDWSCSIEEAKADLGFMPEYDLKTGIKETITWYKEKGWL